MAREVRILTKDGTAHKAFLDPDDNGDDKLFTLEGDNLDESEREILSGAALNDTAALQKRCMRCFGRCGAKNGEDGARCRWPSGHIDEGHKFDGE